MCNYICVCTTLISFNFFRFYITYLVKESNIVSCSLDIQQNNFLRISYKDNLCLCLTDLRRLIVLKTIAIVIDEFYAKMTVTS